MILSHQNPGKLWSTLMKKIIYSNQLILIACIATNLYSAQKPTSITQDPIAFKKHLGEKLEEQKLFIRTMEKSQYGPQMLRGYAEYQNKIDACWEEKKHQYGGKCPNCQEAFNQADKKSKKYINEKGFENEIANILADIIDGIYDK
jgi:hypothetical protein